MGGWIDTCMDTWVDTWVDIWVDTWVERKKGCGFWDK